jgi:hypothetical protein
MRTSLASLLALTLLTVAGCGSRATSRAEYRGPNLLEFTLTVPVRRTMPPERQDGSAQVIDSGGDYTTFELRIFDQGETPCRLQARRSGVEAGRYDVVPGQQCRSLFTYDGAPVSALTEINQGVIYMRGNELRVALTGPFAADTRREGRIVPTQGHASWRFEGYR